MRAQSFSQDGYVPDPAALRRVVPLFVGETVLVLGDVMLDEYVWGQVRRISPEAPIPVVEVERTTVAPGGAANVAQNVVALGGRALLCGVIGADEAGQRLRTELTARGIEDHLLVVVERPTTTKTRILARQQQMVRVDREERSDLPRPVLRRLLAIARGLLASAQSVVVSDYAKGAVAPTMLRLISEATGRGLPVLVDPKGTDYRRYRGATLVTPNLQEATAVLNKSLEGEQARRAGLQALLQQIRCRAVAVTRGSDGLDLLEADGRFTHLPAVAREVYDVTGAGDTLVATMALALGAGAGFGEAAALGNYAAGVVVGKLGTATLTADELHHAISAER